MIPTLKGCGKIIDEYLKYIWAIHHNTAKSRKFEFKDLLDNDLDHAAKQYYLLLTAGCTNLENGTENLCKREKSGEIFLFSNFRKT